mmetsp:Transcript_65423/g.114027  ORF Transcript_65423/g.114027 Transcript_65423/m.114027 type:complete len:198 (+) Transcript_65423:74-667(+)
MAQIIQRHPHTPYIDWAKAKIHPLVEEHEREIAGLRDENEQIRFELRRIAELMKGYIEREKMLLKHFEEMQMQADGTLHSIARHANDSPKNSESTVNVYRNRKGELMDAHQATQNEIHRIAQILQTPPVQPPSLAYYQGGPAPSPHLMGPQVMYQTLPLQPFPVHGTPAPMMYMHLPGAYQSGAAPVEQQPGFVSHA